MALVKIWTGDQALATLLGQPSRGGSPIPGYATWQGAATVWANNINLSLSGGTGVIGLWQAVIDVPITHIPGVPMVRALVVGQRTFTGNDWTGMNVQSVRWVLPGSDDSLVTLFFNGSKHFSLSAPWAFGGIAQFVDPIGNGLEGPLEFWDGIFALGDTLEGGAASDQLRGGGGSDTINGGGGADLMAGDQGDDVFVIGVGHAVAGEAIDGGAGFDSLFTSALPATRDLLQPGHVDMTALNLTSVEQLRTSGSEAVLSANQIGGGGIQSVMGRPGYTDVLTVRMTPGNPTLDLSGLSFTEWDVLQDLIGIIGTLGQDSVVGTNRPDVFVGRGGIDTFTAGDSDDRYILGPGEGSLPIRFNGGNGFDQFQIDAGDNGVMDLRSANLTSVEGLDMVQGTVRVLASQVVGGFVFGSPTVGTEGIRWLTGNSTPTLSRAATVEIYVDPTLAGIALTDMRFTNWNDDGFNDKVLKIIGSASTMAVLGTTLESNWIVLGSSAQGVYVIGGGQADTIGASEFNDYVEGQGGDDLIVTFAGEDLIAGGDGADTIAAMGGNDIISGGVGNDEIDGGGGFDYATYASAGAAVIVDMSAPSGNTGEAAEMC